MVRKPRKSRQQKERPGILVVEDEAMIALDIAAILKETGYDVVSLAATGEAALRTAARRAPALALVDVALRGAIDGVETARQLQARHGVPILFVSAHSDPDTLARMQALRPAGHLSKPFEARQLQQAVAAALKPG